MHREMTRRGFLESGAAAVAAGKLHETEVKWKDASACCVVMASKGYPTAYEKGFEMTLTEEA